jgi:predicted nuclease of predicted toxin-antitoxin system
MTNARLLFDENLSPRLVELLADSFPSSAHVNGVGLHGRPDGDVWSYASEHGYVLVSKDNDFRQLSFLRGAPPKVVWLRIGNAPTKEVVGLLCSRKEDVESFVRDAETALLVIQMERDYP